MAEIRAVGVEGLFQEGVAPRWLVSGVVPERGLVVISGDPYTSKSFSALEMCRAVATGTPFMGYFPVEHEGTTLYIGEDSPTWDIAAQVRKLLAGADMLGGATPRHMLFANKHGASLNTDDGLGQILKLVARHDPVLVVLDSLRELHDQDENDSQVMRRIMGRIRKITELECGPTVVVVHHNGKPGQEQRGAIHRARGSSAINGAADAALTMSRGREPDRFEVEVAKSRSIAVRGWLFDLVWDPDEARFMVVDELGNEEREVMGALAEGQEITTAQAIAVVTRLRPQATPQAVRMFTQRMLTKLCASGHLEHVQRGVYKRAPGQGVGPYGYDPEVRPPLVA